MEELLVSTDAGVLAPLPGGLINDIPRAGNDVRRAHLKGKLAQGQKFSGNLVECRIENADFTNVDLTRCDWKDCRVVGTLFDNCELGHASFITNSFDNCRFTRCRFSDTSISDSTFKNCDFAECDLRSIIVKSSRFEGATFTSCLTSNRVIESSLLIGTKWVSMNIEASLLLGNFGLRRSECQKCTLVTRGLDGKFTAKRWADLPAIVASSEPSPIEYLRFRYFETEDLEADADALAAALDLRNWGNDAVVQASLATQLSSFAQFLLALFAQDRLPIYPVLILHTRNFEILTWLEQRTEAAALYQVAAGVHWILSREVEAFTRLVDELRLILSDRKTVHFAAKGPTDPSYFRRWLDEGGLPDVSVVSVRPRNSPVDLALAFQDHSSLVALLALFLACRTRIELSRLPQVITPAGGKKRPVAPGQLIAVSAGFLPARAAEYELSVRTLLPHSLLLDLRLSVNVAIFQRAKQVLVDLLTPSDKGGPAK